MSLYSRFSSRLLLSTALVSSFCVTVRAQDVALEAQRAQAAVNAVETITVYGSLNARNTFDYAGMVNVINVDQTGVPVPDNSKALFQNSPWLSFQGTARGNGQVAVMRGYDSDGILTLVDGVRQNFKSVHDNSPFLDSALLKSVEVVRGASSALYGSGAMGGVIAYETKDAADLLLQGQSWGAQASLGYQSASVEKMASLTAYGRTATLDGVASLVFRDSGHVDLGGVHGDLITGGELVNGLAKVTWSPVDFHSVKLSYRGYNETDREPNNPQIFGIVEAPTSTDTQIQANQLVDKTASNHTVSLGYRYDNPGNVWLNLDARAFFTRAEVEETLLAPSAGGLVGDERTRTIDTIGFNIHNVTSFGLGSAFANVLTYGVDFYRDEQDGKDSRFGAALGAPDATARNLGVFLQDEITVSDVIPGVLNITPALRYDWYENKNSVGLKNDDQAFSPKLGVAYKPVPWLNVFGSAAQSFRAPNLTELYITGTHFTIPGPFGGSNVFVPNANLKPETNTTYEYGVGVQFSNLLEEGDRFSARASRFDTFGHDYIDQRINFVGFPCCGTTNFVNVRKAELTGYEAELTYDHSMVMARFGYSFVTGKDADTHQYLQNITPHTFSADLAYKLPDYGLKLGWTVNAAAAHNKNTATGPVGAYVVHGAYLNWEPEHIENLSLQAGISNIFDKSYATAFAGSKEQGRNFAVRATLKW